MSVKLMTRIDKVKDILKQMTEEQRLELIRLCNIENNKSKDNDILLKINNNHHCPHCHSNKICKNGFTGKAQQFRCNACKKNYSIRTNTIFCHSKKDIKLWQEYIELFSQGLSLRKIVDAMDGKIKLQTAFYWRHKILKVLSNINDDNNNKLDGIIEADETFFEESQKGARKVKGRQARKRGYSSYTYTKKNKVCVLTAIDGNKTSFTKPVGFGGLEKDDVILLQRHLVKDSVLITDENRTYRNLHDIKLKSLKFGKPENKVYHLNNINSFHSMLKKFMVRFNGVATKYLDYYVSYFQSMKSKIDVFNEILNSNLQYGIVDIRNKRVCFERYVNL
jgi:transposase-like protein